MPAVQFLTPGLGFWYLASDTNPLFARNMADYPSGETDRFDTYPNTKEKPVKAKLKQPTQYKQDPYKEPLVKECNL
jgi:hypothetical protein